jgi:hypothetical protein
MKNKQLIRDWENICNSYLTEFIKKHNLDYEVDPWVNNDTGGIALIGDMYVSLDVIRYDIDNDIEESMFEKWYWKSLDVYQITGENYLSYEAFCKGAPDRWTPENLNKIKQLKEDVENAKQILEKEILNIKKEQD